MNEKVLEIIERTKVDVLENIEKYNKCLIVRNTGFGKTHLMCEIAKMDGWSKVVFISPRLGINEIVGEKLEEIENTVLMSYQLLNSRGAEGIIEYLGVPTNSRVLFLLDEAHFIGAKEWGRVLYSLKLIYFNSVFVGATATPYRSDGVDIKGFFGNIEPFKYTFKDALADGLYKRPYYSFATFEIVGYKNTLLNREKNSKRFKKMGLEEKTNYLKYIDTVFLKYSNLYNVKTIIKEGIDEVADSKEYMKFLVFLPSISLLEEKYSEVAGWFEDLYPMKKVSNYKVYSGSSVSVSDILRLHGSRMTIDLVFCVDMISYGVHIEDLTGIIMLRSTSSQTIFSQQIGRVFSVISDRVPLIYDLVGNNTRSSKYNAVIEHIEGNGSDSIDTERNELELDIIDVNLKKNLVDLDELDKLLDSDFQYMKDIVLDAFLNKGMPLEVACSELGITKEDFGGLL